MTWLEAFSQEHQWLWLSKDYLRDSSSWSSPPLPLLRDIHCKLLTGYDSKELQEVSLLKCWWGVYHFTNTYSPITLINISFINLVFIFRCSSSPINPVYLRRVDFSTLVFSLSSHRHSYIGIDISNTLNTTCRALTLDVLRRRASRDYACGLKEGQVLPTCDKHWQPD